MIYHSPFVWCKHVIY